MSAFDEPYWNALQLLSWVYIGDRSVTARFADDAALGWYIAEHTIVEEGATKKILVETPGARPNSVHLTVRAAQMGVRGPIEDAEKDIRGRLKTGAIVASAVASDSGSRCDIAARDWLDLEIDFDANVAVNDRGHHQYRNLRFERSSVLEAWPSALEQAEVVEPNVMPSASIAAENDATAPIYSTGVAGRPSAWSLIENECRARYGSGERHHNHRTQSESKVDWARALVEWYVRSHPGGPKVTEKTITNNIGPVLRALAEGEPTRPQ